MTVLFALIKRYTSVWRITHKTIIIVMCLCKYLQLRHVLLIALISLPCEAAWWGFHDKEMRKTPRNAQVSSLLESLGYQQPCTGSEAHVHWAACQQKGVGTNHPRQDSDACEARSLEGWAALTSQSSQDASHNCSKYKSNTGLTQLSSPQSKRTHRTPLLLWSKRWYFALCMADMRIW